MRFVTLCCLFAEICGSSQQLSPQTPQKLVSHVKSSPAEEFLPRWVKTNPKTLHVEPMGSMVCNIFNFLNVCLFSPRHPLECK